ncbi:MAG: metal-dependent hydrolase [Acidobacteriaceae bacterium]|nr:metal-dependent hydrolase [Acidobacteriaceae bacterium]
MDNLTHSLTALAMARAGLNRFSPSGTLILLLSANAPDIDIVALSGGPLSYLENHRGYTHSLAALPLMALLSMLVAALVTWRILPWGRAFLLAVLGVASHLLLDSTNGYGLRLLLPFSSRWFHLDLNNLYDVVILLVLLFAAIWPWFARLVGNEIGARRNFGRGTAIAALVFFVLFDAARFLLHQRAVAQLNSVVYGEVAALRVSALPSRTTPLRWTGIVETSAAYRVLSISPFENLDPDAAQVFPKLPRDAPIQAALQTPAFRFFQYFARFPVWSEQPASTTGDRSTRIDLTDLQFGRPGAGAFHCIALVDSHNQVLESVFTYGSGAEFGWVQQPANPQ